MMLYLCLFFVGFWQLKITYLAFTSGYVVASDNLKTNTTNNKYENVLLHDELPPTAKQIRKLRNMKKSVV